ncbi:MAG: hypothetical protein LBN33_10235 [Desulfovibrio sp.]|nr:hypothetical protein [Desulfovibrio sp.]
MRELSQKNKEAAERDVLRDFCTASDHLEEQFARFAGCGTISDPILRSDVGQAWDKGLLWRLKDQAHHLFRRKTKENQSAGLLLDWTIGYIFHECLKLLENVHQDRYYAPKLVAFAQTIPTNADLLAKFEIIRSETLNGIRREIQRISALMAHTRQLFCRYFAGRSDHLPLARFLHDQNDLVRRVFREDYEELIRSVYGEETELLYTQAARSLIESGRFAAASEALAAALQKSPSYPAALELLGMLRHEN